MEIVPHVCAIIGQEIVVVARIVLVIARHVVYVHRGWVAAWCMHDPNECISQRTHTLTNPRLSVANCCCSDAFWCRHNCAQHVAPAHVDTNHHNQHHVIGQNVRRFMCDMLCQTNRDRPEHGHNIGDNKRPRAITCDALVPT